MSAPVQGRPEAKGGGEAEKRCQEEEGGGGAAELQRGLLRRGVRLRPGRRRGSHRLFEDLLVKQQRKDSNEKIIIMENITRNCRRPAWAGTK